jgi:hypothetical protein
MEQPDPPHEKDDNGRVPTAILSWYDFYIRRDMLFLTFTLPE